MSAELRLRDAATALYLAGKWTCDQSVDEARLWEELRDALGLPVGTETDRAAASRNASRADGVGQ